MRAKHLLIILFSFSTFIAKATHVAGSEVIVTYQGDSVYRFQFVFFRDCKGVSFVNPGNSASIWCKDSSFVLELNDTLLKRDYIKDISNVCDTSLTCSPSNTNGAFGFEEHSYSFYLDLKDTSYKKFLKCDKIYAGSGQCCRNGVTTGAVGNFYTFAELSVSKSFGNSSPTYYNVPILKRCLNSPVRYNLGALDPDEGDSLSYQLTQPMISFSQSVLFDNPYSYLSPFSVYYPSVFSYPDAFPSATPPIGIYFDKKTGDLVFTPVQAGQVSVVAIEVLEWRADSSGKMVNIGKTRRDIQLWIDNCPDNNTPIISALDKSSICPSQESILSLTVTDEKLATKTKYDSLEVELIDPLGYLRLKRNTQINFNGKAELEVKIIVSDSIRFYSGKKYKFYVKAYDNNCPDRGVVIKSFQLDFSGAPSLELEVLGNLLVGDSVEITTGQKIGSFIWNTGDTTNSIWVDTVGQYSAILTNSCGTVADTIYVCVEPKDFLYLSENRLCENDSILAYVTNDFGDSVRWKNGSTSDSIYIYTAGVVTVNLTNNCKANFAQAIVYPVEETKAQITASRWDYVLCGDNDSITLKTEVKPYEIVQWSTGDSTSTSMVQAPGWYRLKIMGYCNESMDSAYVDSVRLVEAQILNKSDTFCDGIGLRLSTTPDKWTTHQWSTGSYDSSILIDEPGKYVLTLRNRCGITSDSIDVYKLFSPIVNIDQVDTILCEGDSITLVANGQNGDIYWRTPTNSLKNDSLLILEGGFYKAQISNYCGVATDSVRIDQRILPPVFLGEDTAVIGPTLFKLDAGSGDEYRWYNGDTTRNHTRTISHGTIWVRVKNECGFSWDTLVVTQQVLGIHNLYEEATSIYPNPINNHVMVDPTRIELIAFINSQGQEVKRVNTLERNRIDCSDLKSGVYQVMLIGYNGNKYYEKMIKL